MPQLIEGLKTVGGAVYVLFLPGFALSFVFFGRKAIGNIERIALSFALSIAVVPLLAFYLNLLGVKIALWPVILEVLAIIVISFIAALIMGRFKKGSDAHKSRH